MDMYWLSYPSSCMSPVVMHTEAYTKGSLESIDEEEIWKDLLVPVLSSDESDNAWTPMRRKFMSQKKKCINIHMLRCHGSVKHRWSGTPQWPFLSAQGHWWTCAMMVGRLRVLMVAIAESPVSISWSWVTVIGSLWPSPSRSSFCFFLLSRIFFLAPSPFFSIKCSIALTGSS